MHDTLHQLERVDDDKDKIGLVGKQPVYVCGALWPTVGEVLLYSYQVLLTMFGYMEKNCLLNRYSSHLVLMQY